jgi:predicted HAD superfamily phosphohydrolase YqeG
VSHLLHRVPLLVLRAPQDIFNLRPGPTALLVDIEGTLTDFCPSDKAMNEAIASFDQVATQHGLSLSRLHYITNAHLERFVIHHPEISNRFHTNAHKPFFNLVEEFTRNDRKMVVLGDEYLTDGLLAWRLGFSFALVRGMWHQPLWPRVQQSLGHFLSQVFFTRE